MLFEGTSAFFRCWKAATVCRLTGLCMGMLIACSSLAAQPSVRISQIDSKTGYPMITVHVLITDGGKPISDAQSVKLVLYENEKQVESKLLSQGWPVSTVLVLDRSGSMDGIKIEQAKAAAIRYVDVVPDSYEIAVVAFSGHTQIVGFTRNKDLLRSSIQQISAGGPTALQDAVGTALDLLQGRKGRRAILVLTDGIENASVNYSGSDGLNRLLNDTRSTGATVSTVGLGADVNQSYLQRFADKTGGLYVPTLSPSDLQGIFEKSAGQLALEQELEFKSGAPDGHVGQLRAELITSHGRIDDKGKYIAPEFIPALKGHLAPYFSGMIVLLLAPGIITAMGAFSTVRRFRSLQLRNVHDGSKLIGLSDPNAGPGRPFQVGDAVILCPACHRPHHVRSWRNNSCACMYEPSGKGRVCYRSLCPSWARRLMDSFTNSKTTSAGRVWLCRCSGDKDGY